MIINNFPAIDYQRRLIFAALEDFTPNAALPNLHGGQFGPVAQKWRDAVIEFLSINISYGLPEVAEYPERPTLIDGATVKDFLLNGDKPRGISADIVWNALFFSGAKKLRDLLQNFGLLNWSAFSEPENEEFIASMKIIYAIK